MHEIIRDTPIYQEILREGREEGSLNEAKRILLLITQICFPVLASLAEEIGNLIRDETVFEDIISKITASKNESKASSNLQALYHKIHS